MRLNEFKRGKWKMKSLGATALLTYTFLLSPVMAQENNNASGGKATGSGGTASYSVGQIVYTTNTGTNGTVAQGVQHPFEISVYTGKEEKNIQLSCSAYPNPTANFIRLSMNFEQLSAPTYQLFDTNGKVLELKKITNTETSILMNKFVQGVYFLKIISNNKEVKSFKIIKN